MTRLNQAPEGGTTYERSNPYYEGAPYTPPDPNLEREPLLDILRREVNAERAIWRAAHPRETPPWLTL